MRRLYFLALRQNSKVISSQFLPLITRRFKTYKELGDKTFEQLNDSDFYFKPSAESNSIAVIIQHFYGNAMSRFTNFLTEDGEKEWRQRDEEFEPRQTSKIDLIAYWNLGWNKVFETLNALTEEDLSKTISIRSEPLLVFDALLRQLAHYPYHVGQIVFIGKMLKNEDWQSLSIPKGGSAIYNQQMKK